MSADDTEYYEEEPPIEGSVVAILNDREVIIDVGPSDGAEIGMKFAILGTARVKSPRNETYLNYTFAKAIVKVAEFLDDQHSVGRTFQVIKGKPATPGLSSGMATFTALTQGTPATPDRIETLQVSREDLLLSRATNKRRVRPGDPVRQTWGDEFGTD